MAHLQLLETVDIMNESKGGENDRNTWQANQGDGKGEPYYRDPEGFKKVNGMTTQMGRGIYERSGDIKSVVYWSLEGKPRTNGELNMTGNEMHREAQVREVAVAVATY